MADDNFPQSNTSTSDAAQRSLVDDVRALVEDGRTLVEAELAYQKSRAAVAAAGAKGVLGWGALALALAFFMLMALVMGLLLGLSAVLGPWAATAIIVIALALLAGLCALVASRRWKHTARMLADEDKAQ